MDGKEIAETFSGLGNVMKVEVPMYEQKREKMKIYNDLISNGTNFNKNADTIYSFSDTYFDEFLKNTQQNKYTRLAFFFHYRKLKQVLSKIGTQLKEEPTKERLADLRNLYTEFKYFAQKLFPKEIINSMIYNELIKDGNKDDLVEGYADLQREKFVQAYNKIFENMDGLIRKYDDKIRALSVELTDDMLPVDLYEADYKNLDQESKIIIYYRASV